MYRAFLFILLFMIGLTEAQGRTPLPPKTKGVPIAEVIQSFKSHLDPQNLNHEYTLLLLELHMALEAGEQIWVELSEGKEVVRNYGLEREIESRITDLGAKSLPQNLRASLKPLLSRVDKMREKLLKQLEAEKSPYSDVELNVKTLRPILNWMSFHVKGCGRVRDYYFSLWEKQMIAKGSDRSFGPSTYVELKMLKNEDLRVILNQCLSPSELANVSKIYHHEN